MILTLSLSAPAVVAYNASTVLPEEVDWITLLNLSMNQQQQLTHIERTYKKDSAALQKKHNQCGPTEAFHTELTHLKSKRRDAMRTVLTPKQRQHANQILMDTYRNKHLSYVNEIAHFLMLPRKEIHQLYQQLNTQHSAVQWPLEIQQHLDADSRFAQLIERNLTSEQYQKWRNRMTETPKSWPQVEQFYQKCRTKLAPAKNPNFVSFKAVH